MDGGVPAVAMKQLIKVGQVVRRRTQSCIFQRRHHVSLYRTQRWLTPGSNSLHKSVDMYSRKLRAQRIIGRARIDALTYQQISRHLMSLQKGYIRQMKEILFNLEHPEKQ